MSKKPTVTIGIPALNEEANIGPLIRDLLNQSTSGFILEGIIVASDGSTDGTVDIVKSFKSHHIRVIDNPRRLGLAARQNQLISLCSSDILVLLDADIRVPDKDMVARLIAPIVSGQAALTSPTLIELPPRSAVESILDIGMKLKRILFTTWQGGQNGYLCHGAVRAFVKKLYSRLKFPQSVGEDMYSYLACLKANFRFQYVRDTYVLYRNPMRLSDHLKQSQRFFDYHHSFFREFDPGLVKKELNIPISIYIRSVLPAFSVFLKNPLQFIAYLLLFSFLNLRFYFFSSNGDLWQASSTKSL